MILKTAAWEPSGSCSLGFNIPVEFAIAECAWTPLQVSADLGSEPGFGIPMKETNKE